MKLPGHIFIDSTRCNCQCTLIFFLNVGCISVVVCFRLKHKGGSDLLLYQSFHKVH